MTELWALTLFAACVAIWVSIMRAREKAIAYAKKICAEEGVQLLDFTVALERLSLTRDQHGRAAFRRSYCFEFSDTGNNRREGRIILIGNRLESSYMEPHRFPQDLRSVGEVLH
jgi:hypothetical protein